MNRVAFEVFGFPILWYGVIIACGALLGIFLARYNCRFRGIKYDDVLDVVLIALPIAIIGARLYYVIFEHNYYIKNPSEILNIRQGGLAIHGGVIFGALTAYIYSRYKKIDFLSLMDIAVPSVILGQGIGRWGNFFNQEAHGREVTKEFISKFPAFIQKGMYIDGAYYQPTFLYESICNLIIFFILWYLIRKVRLKGTTLLAYMGLYSVVRFFIEGLRTDSLMFLGLRIAQVISIMGILIAIVGFAYINGHKEKFRLKEK